MPTSMPWQDVRDSLWDLSSPVAALMQIEAPPVTQAPTARIRLSEVVAALTCALDITEGQPEGHAARTCVIGMRIGELLRLPPDDLTALFYALQLKDLGCSSNAAKVTALFAADDHDVKRDLKTTDWSRLGDQLRYILRNVAPHGGLLQKAARFLRIGKAGPATARRMVQIRCERGAEIARMFGLPEATATAIRGLDEHWNGQGHPTGARGPAIPLLARIAGLAQTVEVFARQFGVPTALAMARSRRKSWFDPQLVDTLLTIAPSDALWSIYAPGADLPTLVAQHEPADQHLIADDDCLDRIALGFAQVVDAKSPWTYRHSEDVADLTVATARILGLGETSLRELRRAALLHDLGKLGVSNLILDKPGKLTDAERLTMQRHPMLSQRILSRVRGFATLAEIAGSHHERLDGKGYYRGLDASRLGKEVRCLVVADMCEALSAARPYRDTMPMDRVLTILAAQCGPGICPDAFAAIKQHVLSTGFRCS